MSGEPGKLHGLHAFMASVVYFYIGLDFLMFIFFFYPPFHGLQPLILKILKIPVFSNVLYIKGAGFFLILLSSLGTTAKKNTEFSWKKSVAVPLIFGLIIYFGSCFFFSLPSPPFLFTLYNGLYIFLTLAGAILLNISLDNISKQIHSRLGKDLWNIQNETWLQETEKIDTPFSVNIPTRFYYKKRNNEGWLNVDVFRGNLTVGIPGSGKTFSVIIPFIRQLMAKEFALLVYDYKYPDLYNLCAAHYQEHRKKGKFKNFRFAVLDVNNIDHSIRVNPLSTKYLSTLAECQETAQALVEALRKGAQNSGGGSDQFFTQSAVNFLTAIFFFLLKYENGQYCSLPHAIALLNKDYATLFKCFDTQPELRSLLSPFYTAFQNKSFDQLEGQIGTLKINIGRIASKESFWVFSADEFSLDINHPDSPAILILSNNPATMNINGAFYSVVLNRITPLMNNKGKVPSLIAVDELPTLYFHKLEHLLATGRSNKIAVVLGVQDLPQLRLNWSADTSRALVSIIGNIFLGIVRDKETLEWAEKLFGQVRQRSESVQINRTDSSLGINETLHNLVQSGKISSLKTGEMVGVLAQGHSEDNMFVSSAFSAKLLRDEAAEDLEKKFNGYPPILYKFDNQQDREKLLLLNYLKIFADIDHICVSI